jgi:hypothetical protein
MTAGTFTKFQDLAVRLITAKGEQSTLTRTLDAAPPDSSKPHRVGTPTTTDYTVSAVWFSPADIGRAGFLSTIFRQIDELVQDASWVAFVPAKGLAITPSPTTDTLTRVNGARYQILRVDEIQPNEDQIMYTIFLGT